jgi:hypothetical protein
MKLVEFLLVLFVVFYFVCPSVTDNVNEYENNTISYNYDDTVKVDEWELIAVDVEATVYNAVPEQCDSDPSHTASMFKLNLDDVYSHKIIAMERTFMKDLGLKYGDVVKIEGTGRWDGVWQIQDTMNKRFAGQKKIDILVPNEIKTGKWNTVKLYTLLNKENTYIYTYNMAPQAEETQI